MYCLQLLDINILYSGCGGSLKLVEVFTLHSWYVWVCVCAICSSFSQQLLYKFRILFCVKCLRLGITYCECSFLNIALKPSLSTVWVGTMSLCSCSVVACNVHHWLFFVEQDSDNDVGIVILSFAITWTPCVIARGCSQQFFTVVDLSPHGLVLPLFKCLSPFPHISKHVNLHLF